MIQRTGYYLLEVLVALMIFSFSSLSLFKYQWQLHQTKNTLDEAWSALQMMDNLSERVIAGDVSLADEMSQQLSTLLPDPKVKIASASESAEILMSWQAPAHASYKRSTLTRRL